MAHYILSDDFDYDSIIIKAISFTFDESQNNKLSLTITYNDNQTLTGDTNLGQFLTANQVQALINASLVTYPTITDMNTAINNALALYDKSTIVDSKISTAITNALASYDESSVVDSKISTTITNALTSYDKSSVVDSKISTAITNAKVDSILFTYNATTNTIDATLTFGDGTLEYGSVKIPLVTTTSDGLMSASDKNKLDGIETGANRYVLPIASYGAIGGVKGSAKTSETIPVAIDANGFMWVTPGQYDLPHASATILGGVKANAKVAESTPVAVDADGFLWVTPGAIEIATPTIVGGVRVGSGLMIDSTGLLVNAYDLPTASKTTLGGVKVDGTTITITNGVISANFDTTLYGASLSLTDTTLTLKNTAGTGISSVTLPTGLTKVTKTSFAVGDDMSSLVDNYGSLMINGNGKYAGTFECFNISCGKYDNRIDLICSSIPNNGDTVSTQFWITIDLTTKLITSVNTDRFADMKIVYLY